MVKAVRSMTMEELLSIRTTLERRQRFLYQTILGPVIDDLNQIDIELRRRDSHGQTEGHDCTL